MSKQKETPSWLTLLREELSLIDDDQLIDPGLDEDEPLGIGEEETESNETVLGTASMEIRRLWTYFCRMEEKATRLLVDARYDRSSVSSKEETFRHSAELRAKAGMARDILFLCLRDTYGIWNPNLGVGLRRGWQVVSFKSSNNPFADLLKRYM